MAIYLEQHVCFVHFLGPISSKLHHPTQYIQVYLQTEQSIHTHIYIGILTQLFINKQMHNNQGIVMVPSGVKSPHVTVLLCPAKVFKMVLWSAFHIHTLQSSDPAIIKCPRGCHLSHYKNEHVRYPILWCILWWESKGFTLEISWMKISPQNQTQNLQGFPGENA